MPLRSFFVSWSLQADLRFAGSHCYVDTCSLFRYVLRHWKGLRVFRRCSCLPMSGYSLQADSSAALFNYLSRLCWLTDRALLEEMARLIGDIRLYLSVCVCAISFYVSLSLALFFHLSLSLSCQVLRAATTSRLSLLHVTYSVSCTASGVCPLVTSLLRYFVSPTVIYSCTSVIIPLHCLPLPS